MARTSISYRSLISACSLFKPPAPWRSLARFLLLLLITCTGATTWAAADESVRVQKRVVVIYPARPDAPVPAVMNPAFKKVLEEGLSGQLDLHMEYIDLFRFPQPEYQEALYNFLSTKYRGQRVDLVITFWSGPPNQFMTLYRPKLFPEAAVVYILRNSDRPEPNSTGVYYDYDIKRTIEMALTIQPDTAQIFVVVGSSEVDKNFLNRARPQFQEFANRVKVTYLTDMTMAQLLQSVSNLPPKSILYYLPVTRDSAGNSFITTDSLDKVAAAANAPLYIGDTILLDRGTVGGGLLDYEMLALRSAELALRILRGEKADDIPVTKIEPFVNVVDWRQLKRWGLEEARVPVGTVVRFKEPTFWEQYKWRIVGALALIALQTAFIAVLLVERKRRLRANASLDRLNAELEERISARTAALDNKSRELETFAYSVAHDLKAPLRGIDGYSRLLLDDHAADLNEEGRSFLHTIHSSTEEMSQLIDDLLEYSRLERREFKTERFELGPLVSSVVAHKKREATEGYVEFVVSVNGGTVVADANGVIQSLRNYLDNAIKFTRKVPQPHIEVGSQETPKNFRVWVRDNGVGFDMKYHDRIFDIFQRLNPGEEYPGTGVGLAIVRKAMERMGGRAWAESEPGQGATFFLEIPKQPEGDDL